MLLQACDNILEFETENNCFHPNSFFGKKKEQPFFSIEQFYIYFGSKLFMYRTTLMLHFRGQYLISHFRAAPIIIKTIVLILSDPEVSLKVYSSCCLREFFPLTVTIGNFKNFKNSCY